MLHADLTLLLHTHQVADQACFLFTAYTCCMQVLPLLLRTCVAGGTAYPYGAWDCLCYCRLASQRGCLPTLAFHVNVYALITPPPWSIVSFFRLPLQRSPSVVTLASTYCSFPVCGDRQEFRESPFVRPERACLSFAGLLYLPPLWRAARPRSERSVGDPVIICLLFHLPTFMARGPSGPAFHCLSVQFSPVMARGPSGPAYHCLLCNLPPLLRAARPRSERSVGGPASFAFCFVYPPLWRAARAGQLFIAFLPSYGARPERASLSLPFCAICPVMARGPSSERALRRQPSYHLPFASFTHLYGALPERASFSLPSCPIFPRYGVRPERASLSLPSVQFAPVMARGSSSERALRRRPVIICLLFHLPTFMARGSSGPAFHCLFAQFPPVMVCGRSRPAYHCLSAQFAPVMAPGPSASAP